MRYRNPNLFNKLLVFYCILEFHLILLVNNRRKFKQNTTDVSLGVSRTVLIKE